MIQCQYVTVTNLPGTVDHRWHGVVNRYGPQTGWCRCVVRFGQMKRPRRGRRNRIHRFRVHQRPRHRPARRAARQGRPLPRRPVPTLALSPVLHQHRPTGTRGRHHPPPTRDPRTVFDDLIDGPLAHLPSGRFGANSAWILCAAIAHNLLRAAGVLAGDQHARARGSCTCPLTGPGRNTGSGCGTTRSDTAHQSRSDPDNPPDTALPTPQMLGCGELSGASRNRTCEVRVRGHARPVVAVGCRSRTAFTGGLAPELQPAVAVCDHRNDGIRDERR